MVIHPDHTVVLASRSRAVWRSLFERDLDLLLLDLIYTSPEFGRWLLESTIGLPRADDASLSLEGAWHSVIGFDGRESDLEALWTFNGSRIRILIEDKIEAECQPGQAAAYAERAKRYVEDGEADRAATVLIAPLGYPERYSEDTAAFDYHVSIESIRDWVASNRDLQPRSAYIVALLDHMLDRSREGRSTRRGGVNGRTAGRGGKPQFPELYELIREELRSAFPHLGITNSSEGEWVYFSFPGKRGGVLLRYRMRDHWAELVFPKKSFDEETLRAALALAPLPGAFIGERGQTERVVWSPTPEIDVRADPRSQVEQLRGALATVSALANWYPNVGRVRLQLARRARTEDTGP